MKTLRRLLPSLAATVVIAATGCGGPGPDEEAWLSAREEASWTLEDEGPDAALAVLDAFLAEHPDGRRAADAEDARAAITDLREMRALEEPGSGRHREWLERLAAHRDSRPDGVTADHVETLVRAAPRVVFRELFLEDLGKGPPTPGHTRVVDAAYWPPHPDHPDDRLDIHGWMEEHLAGKGWIVTVEEDSLEQALARAAGLVAQTRPGIATVRTLHVTEIRKVLDTAEYLPFGDVDQLRVTVYAALLEGGDEIWSGEFTAEDAPLPDMLDFEQDGARMVHGHNTAPAEALTRAARGLLAHLVAEGMLSDDTPAAENESFWAEAGSMIGPRAHEYYDRSGPGYVADDGPAGHRVVELMRRATALTEEVLGAAGDDNDGD